MPYFLIRLIRWLFCSSNSSMDRGLYEYSDDDYYYERDVLGSPDKAIMDKETEELHRAVARTITSVSFSESARKSPDDQILLMCAERAEDAMAMSLAAIENRVPGFLPMRHIKKPDLKPVRLPKYASRII